MKKIAENKMFVLCISGAVGLLLLVWNWIGNYTLCDYFWTGSSAGECPHIFAANGVALFPFFPLLLFSLITYFMRESVSRPWVRFAVPATLLSVLAIFLMHDSSGGGFGPQLSFGKGDVAFICGALFILISIGIIAYGYLRPAKK